MSSKYQIGIKLIKKNISLITCFQKMNIFFTVLLFDRKLLFFLLIKFGYSFQYSSDILTQL